MNKATLKSYAPKARLDFIKAVTERANILGITATGTAPAQVRGDVAIIDGAEWPAKVAAQRDQLIARMRREGFAQTCEAVAYTWFNRFAALRYMELHDYLGHGHRALSSGTGNLPDILTHAADLAQGGAHSGLPGLNAAKVVEMKLAGNRDGELYRMLLVAQCNALNAAMPFLFERIDDDTELLLPDNLLRTDSVIAKLVQEIPEEDWAEVEVIGWLYQFYISEKKDQVIGKVVKSEDIPAATQLFTPNWIVQYLVQNSVGRLWLMANPASTLAGQWPYYIQPAEQTPEVQAQLDALIQTRMDEDGGSLNPETITVLDPACGSGHILVVAYDVLKAIYLERGYQARAIPRLILEKNLYGLDIDDRAAQMAGFALLMKARADDRRLFNEPPKLNVLSLQESKGLDAAALAMAINSGGTERVDVAQLRWLIDTFEHAKTFGSLIKIGTQLSSNLRELLLIVEQAAQARDLYAQAAAQDLLPLVQQALVLGMQFDAVVANPPYMGGRNGMNDALKDYSESMFASGKADIYASFIDRSLLSLKPGHGALSFITMEGWMFLPSFGEIRRRLQNDHAITSLLHLGPRAFETISGEIVRVVAFTVTHKSLAQNNFLNCFRLVKKKNELEKRDAFLMKSNAFSFLQKDFSRIPEGRMAYWLSASVISCFDHGRNIETIAPVRQGFQTGDNDRFMRMWYEVSFNNTVLNARNKEEVFSSGRKWVPYNKGGEFRKWFGNNNFVVAFDKNNYETLAVSGNCLPSRAFYFKAGITWSAMGGAFGARLSPAGFTFSAKGASAFPQANDTGIVLSLLNSKVADVMFEFLAPTLDFNVGAIRLIPIPQLSEEIIHEISEKSQSLIKIAADEWDSSEVSWNFVAPQVIGDESKNLRLGWDKYRANREGTISRATALTEEINRTLISAYGLSRELSAESDASEFDYLKPALGSEAAGLISYALGCMMGRYSLDEPGLIYAHAGNVDFDANRYTTFPADADGIVPLTDERWFADDAASRVREFLLAVWGADTLEENMAWLAESLGTKASETPDETIRRYLADKFFKDHLQTYKKRPIYWLFSSGKQGAFQALVYLHRYTEGTLARLRAEYVVPLIAKVASRLDMLAQDVAAASSAAARTKLQKQIEALRKKQIELLAYDEKLRHYADMRITLDLDDGVKVNYSKFGDLLDGVKLVTGGAGDD